MHHVPPIGSRLRTRRGYVLLLSVIFIGAMASTIVASLLMLGISASKVGQSFRQSMQALELAQACAEYALQSLRSSPNYAGNTILGLDTGICEVLPIGGTGNSNRLLCVEGRAGSATKRIEIIIAQLLPSTTIDSWNEVYSFTLCQ